MWGRAGCLLVAALLLGSVTAPVAGADRRSNRACRAIERVFDDDDPKISKKERSSLRRAARRLKKSDESGASKAARDTRRAAKGKLLPLVDAAIWCESQDAPTTTTTLPPPQFASGVGDSVVDVTFPPDPAIITILYNGGSNFIVESYDAFGNGIDLLVNTIGSYAGTRLINSEVGGEVTRLGIQASGSWSLEIKPLDAALRVNAPGRYDGSGDSVFFLDGRAGTAHFVAPADTNFIVHAYTTTSVELVVNEIGPYDGVSIIPSDVFLFDVTATGAWSVEFGR